MLPKRGALKQSERYTQVVKWPHPRLKIVCMLVWNCRERKATPCLTKIRRSEYAKLQVARISKNTKFPQVVLGLEEKT